MQGIEIVMYFTRAGRMSPGLCAVVFVWFIGAAGLFLPAF